jgi:putative sigma-54 modulation protein
MKITIHPHNNVRIPGTTEEFAQRRMERLERYLPRIREIRLELSQQNNKRGEDFSIAQLTLYHERGAILRTEERVSGFSRESMESAIGEALDKMHRRIDRFKGKRQDKRRHRSDFAPSDEELELAEDDEIFDEYADYPPPSPDPEPAVARRKNVSVTRMSELDAIEQMELLGHTFFMYHDTASDKIAVVYKRSEGDYGLLIPDDGGAMA